MAEYEIPKEAVQQYQNIEKSGYANMLYSDEVYYQAYACNYYALMQVITDGMYHDLIQHRDFYFSKFNLWEISPEIQLAQKITKNVLQSKRLANRMIIRKDKKFITEICPACNGKRIMSFDHHKEPCPICHKLKNNKQYAMGIVLVPIVIQDGEVIIYPHEFEG